MTECAKIRNSRIQEIFKSMEYGSSCETTQLVFDWVKNRESSFFAYIDKPTEQPNGTPTGLLNAVKKETLCTIHVPDIDTVKTILAKGCERKWTDLDPFERVKLINKIGTEIEKKAELFAQLEVLARGILAKDTKIKAVPLLAQYFRYYSAFAYPSNEETKLKPLGVAVGVISKENYLAHLGLFLAPALAAGCNIILQIGLQLAPAAFLLQEIIQSAGLPEGIFRIIPSDDGELLPYLTCDKVDVLTLFVDLNNEKYRGINTLNKKILVLTSYKTPAIVFDSADLDAASESVIESSWSCQSMLPWTTDTILVQENIFPAFLNKLKSKMKSLEVSTADNKSARISINISNTESSETLNGLIKQAKLQGIEVFQAQENSDKWSPTLFIGGKVKHIALRSEDGAKSVTILAFRSIDEAINLANNCRQGLWASVWSENGSIINEVTRKLQVSNICVNGSYGFSPDVVISPTKESGIGNFGGKEGFFEYLSLETTKYCSASEVPSTTSVANIDSVVNTAKKAQENWHRVSKIQRQKVFQEFAENLPSLKEVSGEFQQKWTNNVYAVIKSSQKDNILSTISGYNLTSVREPRGVIVIDSSDNSNAQLILTALFEGNSLIILTTGNSDSVLKLLSSKLPSGVLNLLPYDSSLLNKLAANKKVSCYFGNDSARIFRCLSLQNSKNYMSVTKNMEDIYGKAGVTKNIWSDIGKSTTCTF